MRKLITSFMAVAGLAGIIYAVGLNGLIVNNPGLAYAQRFVFNLANADVNTVSATVVYASATFSSSTFTGGEVSTGSLVIANAAANAALSTAAASNAITVNSSTAEYRLDSIIIPRLNKPGAHVLLAGRDWSYLATTTGTAASLAAAIVANVPYLSVSVSSNIIYTTAPVGAFYNGVAMTTNNNASLSVASATFLGGADNAVVVVNGFPFRANVDFGVGASSQATATNLAAAINAKRFLSNFVTATASGTGTISLQSLAPGAAYNFPLASLSAAVSTSAAAMTGGLTPAWVINTASITVPGHGLPLALAVTLSTTANTSLSGLTNQTTYYVIPIDANTVRLATSQAQALAGLSVPITSSFTATSATSFNLIPLAFVAGTAGFDWEVSNDAVHWTAVQTTSVTYSNGGAGFLNTSFGQVLYNYLSLNVSSATAGALNLQVTAQGTYTY